MAEPQGKPSKRAARAIFRCSLCNDVASTVELTSHPPLRPEAYPDKVVVGRLVQSGFPSDMTAGVLLEQYPAVRRALARRSAHDLWALDPLWAPFYCPTCRCSYCRAHWLVFEVRDDEFPAWHDFTCGICPRGHQRMLED